QVPNRADQPNGRKHPAEEKTTQKHRNTPDKQANEPPNAQRGSDGAHAPSQATQQRAANERPGGAAPPGPPADSQSTQPTHDDRHEPTTPSNSSPLPLPTKTIHQKGRGLKRGRISFLKENLKQQTTCQPKKRRKTANFRTKKSLAKRHRLCD